MKTTKSSRRKQNSTKINGRMVKRLVSAILTAAIVVSTFAMTSVSVSAAQLSGNIRMQGTSADVISDTDILQEQTNKTYSHENYEIIYTVKSEWQNHQAVEITLKNIGETAIRNWAVSIETLGCITGLWNAVLLTAEEKDGNTTVKNAGWNSVIQPGQSVTFGYTLEGESLSVPAYILLCSVTEKEQETAETELIITGEWEEGFQGEIHIHNHSEKAVSGWSLTFHANFMIENLWNGELTSNEDGTYTVSHTAWQNEIPAGGEHVVGFTGTKTGEAPEVADCTVYGVEEYGKTGSSSGEDKPSAGDGKEEETIDWEDTTDTDGDGLPDVYERYMFESDPENADSDGDGLPDGYEVRSAGTSPVLADSNEDGISDGDSDEDGDGLTNMEEYLLGTNPLTKDSDYDGLEDKEELETYGTEPLTADTDGDGISDGDEVKLGLDPLNPATNGVPDNRYCIPQEIGTDSAVLRDVNETAGNPYEASLSFQASGAAEHNLSVDGTSYGTVFDSEAAVGSPIFIEYNDDMSLEMLRLTYHVDEGMRENEMDLFGEDTTELHGIRRLNVFWFDEGINMLLPVETFHDEEKGLVYADMDKDGVFCLMDMEKWIYGLAEKAGMLGTEDAAYILESGDSVPSGDGEPEQGSFLPDEEQYLESVSNKGEEAGEELERFLEEAEALFSRRNNKTDIKMRSMSAPVAFYMDNEEPKEAEKSVPVDLVYILQTEGNDSDFIGNSWIIPWYDMYRLEEEYSNVRMCVLEERLDGTYTQAGKNRACWYESSGAYTDYAQHMPCKVTEETFYRSALDMVLSDDMDFRQDSVKLVMYVPAGITNIGFYHFGDCLTEMAERGICYSELHDNDNPYTIYTQVLRSYVEKTGGRFFSFRNVYWDEDVLGLYRDRIETFSAGKPQTVFKGITATGYQTVTLEVPLSSTGGWDSDHDGLTDWEEVNTELLLWNQDGSITLPTLLYCVENYSEDSYVIAGLDRFKKDVTQHGVPSNIYEDYIRHIMANTEILPIHSHPRRVDTDGDGILDNLDRYNSETMDVRYRNVSPLRVNTIETLYPELKKSGQNPSNNEQNAVYFNIDGNDIELVARILFYDDYAQKFIENGVELNKTYEDVILEGLKLWSGKFTGAYSKEENVHYDFIEGMKINVTFTAEVYHEEDLFSDNRYVHIYVENDEYTGGKWYDGCYGIPHTATQGWSPEKIGTGILWDCGQITMYRGYADHPKYTESQYQHTIAHEFGHVLGLDDVYPSANGGIQLKDNDEVPIEPYYAGILMCNNGFSYANDFEMIFEAFAERKYQAYFDYKKKEKSKVIRLEQSFEGDSQ